jgi:hypothetical protein
MCRFNTGIPICSVLPSPSHRSTEMKAAAAIVREVFQTLLEDRDTNCDLCNAYLNHFLNCSASRQMSWSTLTDLFR